MNLLDLITYQVPTMAILIFLQANDTPSWARLGIGGALAGAMFFFYREDRKQSEKRLSEDRRLSDERLSADRKRSEERLKEVAEDFREVVQETARTLATLAALIDNIKRGH